MTIAASRRNSSPSIHSRAFLPDHSETPVTAALDAGAVVVLRGKTGRSYWAWRMRSGLVFLGRDLDGFRRAAPAWADDAVRLCLTADAFLLGGFTAFSQFGRLHRLTLARQIFGRDRVDGEVGRIRSVLSQWACGSGRGREAAANDRLPGVPAQPQPAHRRTLYGAVRTDTSAPHECRAGRQARWGSQRFLEPGREATWTTADLTVCQVFPCPRHLRRATPRSLRWCPSYVTTAKGRTGEPVAPTRGSGASTKRNSCT